MTSKRTPRDLTNAWPGAQLKIFNGTEPSKRLCRIPISFLESCGVPDLRSVVRTIAEAAVKEAVQLRDEHGEPLEKVDVLTVGSLFLHPVDPTGALTVIELPQGNSRFRPVNLSPTESTFSDSTNSAGRPDQVSNLRASKLSNVRDFRMLQLASPSRLRPHSFRRGRARSKVSHHRHVS